MGLGKSGLATARALKAGGAHVIAWDDSADRRGAVAREGIEVADLADASLSFQSLGQWRDAGYLERLLDLQGRVWRDRAYGDMWSYMLLADGLIDITGEFDVKVYDLAALIPIVEEAGGRFTSIDGTPGPWSGSALATNGALHDAVLGVLGHGPR